VSQSADLVVWRTDKSLAPDANQIMLLMVIMIMMMITMMVIIVVVVITAIIKPKDT
jgi:hypothetical protein